MRCGRRSWRFPLFAAGRVAASSTIAKRLPLSRSAAPNGLPAGYASHAAYQVEEQTGGRSTRVKRRSRSWRLEVARRREAADMVGRRGEAGGFEIAAWDWDFYAEKVRKAKSGVR